MHVAMNVLKVKNKDSRLVSNNVNQFSLFLTLTTMLRTFNLLVNYEDVFCEIVDQQKCVLSLAAGTIFPLHLSGAIISVDELHISVGDTAFLRKGDII